MKVWSSNTKRLVRGLEFCHRTWMESTGLLYVVPLQVESVVFIYTCTYILTYKCIICLFSFHHLLIFSDKW